MDRQIKIKNNIIFYTLLAYGFTWILWISAISLGYKDLSFIEIINFEFEDLKEVLAFLLFRLGVYGPLAAAIITIYYKKLNIKEFWQRITNWKIEIKWYLYVLLLPIFINIIVVLIGMLIGIPLNNFFNSNIPFNLVIVYFIYELLTSGLEEPGWRGFVLPALEKIYDVEKASWILGIIWAVWHYPYVIFLYSGIGIIPTIFSLAGFTMSIIAQTFIITWFYNNTKSVLVTILLHTWLNTSTTFILGNITIINPAMGIIPGLVSWGIVFVLLKNIKRR